MSGRRRRSSTSVPLSDPTMNVPLTKIQDRDPFVQAAKRTPVDLRAWAVSLMERDNRKSHLAPQLSPSTEALLRSSDSPTYMGQGGIAIGADDRLLQTPTSGEIPIVGAIMSPRDQRDQFGVGASSISTRSPTAARNVAGLPGGPPLHPGLGPRVATTNSIPTVAGVGYSQAGQASQQHQQMQHSTREYDAYAPSSAGQATFSLPVRGGPPAVPLPALPTRRDTGEDLRSTKSEKRAATFGPPHNGSYGLGYGAQ
jgi:mitogen-activated protein kinase kinase